MKEVCKIRLYEIDPKYRTEIIEFLIVPFFAILVYLGLSNALERYQIVIFGLIVSLLFFYEIYKFLTSPFLHILTTDDKKVQVLIKKKDSILYEIKNVEIGELGWNYNISESLSQVKIYSITHRTNHNLVLKFRSYDDSKKLNLLQKLKPWQELNPNYPYLNDLNPSEMAYQIKNLKKLNQILVK